MVVVAGVVFSLLFFSCSFGSGCAARVRIFREKEAFSFAFKGGGVVVVVGGGCGCGCVGLPHVEPGVWVAHICVHADSKGPRVGHHWVAGRGGERRIVEA